MTEATSEKKKNEESMHDERGKISRRMNTLVEKKRKWIITLRIIDQGYC